MNKEYMNNQIQIGLDNMAKGEYITYFEFEISQPIRRNKLLKSLLKNKNTYLFPKTKNPKPIRLRY